MSNISDDQPAKLIKENGFSHEVPQSTVPAHEIVDKNIEQKNIEKFTIPCDKRIELYENGIKDQENTETSLKVSKTDWQIKNKFKAFYDTTNSSKDDTKLENSQLNEKCFSDYKKVKENLISIDEFVLNLKKYKEKLNERPANLNRRLELPKTLPSIKEVIFNEKPIEIEEMPLAQLKISSATDYALNKEETERIQTNLPLFYNLIFKNDGKITDDQKDEEIASTGVVKSEFFFVLFLFSIKVYFWVPMILTLRA